MTSSHFHFQYVFVRLPTEIRCCFTNHKSADYNQLRKQLLTLPMRCTYPDLINHHEMRLEAARIKLQRRLLTSDFEISCVVASSTPQMYSRRAQTCPTHQRSWLFSFRYIKGVLKMQIGRLDHLIAILF